MKKILVNASKKYEVIVEKGAIDRIGEYAKDVMASTFHSLCVRILRRDGDKLGFDSSFTIYDTDDQKRVIKEIMKDFNIDDKKVSISSVKVEDSVVMIGLNDISELLELKVSKDKNSY